MALKGNEDKLVAALFDLNRKKQKGIKIVNKMLEIKFKRKNRKLMKAHYVGVDFKYHHVFL